MTPSYKQKLLGEINEVPETLLPRFYRIMHILRKELTKQVTSTPTRGSLKGIWGKGEIDESLIAGARESMFSYEYKKGKK